MAKKQPPAADTRETPSFEKAMAELESIIDGIEQGEIGLEEALRQYERGVTLLRQCRDVLKTAEQRVKELDRLAIDTAEGGAEPRGRASESPF